MGSPHQSSNMEKHPKVTILLSLFLVSSTVQTLPLLILLAQSPSSPLLTTQGQNFVLLGEYNEILDTAEGIKKNNMEQDDYVEETENNEESIILDIDDIEQGDIIQDDNVEEKENNDESIILDDIVTPFELEDMVQSEDNKEVIIKSSTENEEVPHN